MDDYQEYSNRAKLMTSIYAIKQNDENKNSSTFYSTAVTGSSFLGKRSSTKEKEDSADKNTKELFQDPQNKIKYNSSNTNNFNFENDHKILNEVNGSIGSNVIRSNQPSQILRNRLDDNQNLETKKHNNILLQSKSNNYSNTKHSLINNNKKKWLKHI